ncbi:Protein kinase domain containing protein [Musa troglodytarum]|uniref:Protein kinase domain containing protein n=1 Tax=Musa troglodytarum TaxID=320322 RepID=A0A9E7K2G2_9LILI|nr:Protein kinase domain containing protein [Musa troglodytarum]
MRVHHQWLGSCGTASRWAPPVGFITCTRSAREGSSTETSRPPTSSSLQISNLRYRPLPPAASKSTSSRLHVFTSQISDFGLAKWLPSEWTHRAISPIEGTFGYILLNSWIQATHSDARNGGADGIHRCLAPEYFMHGIVDEKTDVFAFGVFLLEIISGRKPVDGSHRSLLSWARPFLDDGSLQMLVDPRLGDGYDMEQLKRLSFAASLCIRATAALRPSMTEILELLEGGEISQDRWKMLEEEEVEEEFWGFDDLDDDDDDDDCDTPSTPSTGSSQP